MSESPLFGDLRRTWWFPGMPHFRPYPPFRKYAPFDLDAQPPAPADLDADLSFLSDKPERTMWAITQDDDNRHSRVLTMKNLSAIIGSHPIPPALATFAQRPSLQKKIRSGSGCHLDLGDFAIPIVGESGVLCHFLSDQQWLKHWLIYCGEGPENGTVVVADLPYGFDTPGESEHEVPTSIDLGTVTDLHVCADSFEEFLYRFWVENELSNTQRGEPFSGPEIERYARQLEHSD